MVSIERIDLLPILTLKSSCNYQSRWKNVSNKQFFQLQFNENIFLMLDAMQPHTDLFTEQISTNTHVEKYIYKTPKPKLKGNS